MDLFDYYDELSATTFVLYLIVAIIMIVSLWKIFLKANKPGWASIIPFYNVIVELEIIGKPWWWLLLLFIPIVNVVIAIMMTYYLAKCFGKGAGFTVGLIIIPIIFYPILAFGDAEYVKPVAEY